MSFRSTAITLCAIVVALAGASPALSAPLIVSEADFGGDFGPVGAPTAVGTLGAGTNTISGFFDGSAAGDINSTADAFTFILPSSITINSLSFITSNVSSPAGGAFQATFEIGSSPTMLTGTSATTFTLSPAFLSAGTNLGEVFTVFPGQTRSFNYVFQIGATSNAAVPEPESIALLAIGLLGLTVASGRRRS